MCGRMDIDADQIGRWAGDVLGLDWDTETNHDLRPTQLVSVLTPEHRQALVPWGIQPTWAKKLLINAQGETVAEKKTFKRAFNEHRCLVPCSGWYEWRDEGGSRKQKYRFCAADGDPLLMAGLLLPEQEAIKLVTLTITPNDECAPYHHRMPAFIPPEHLSQWLAGTPDDALQLVCPMPNGSIAIQAS